MADAAAARALPLVQDYLERGDDYHKVFEAPITALRALIERLLTRPRI